MCLVERLYGRCRDSFVALRGPGGVALEVPAAGCVLVGCRTKSLLPGSSPRVTRKRNEHENQSGVPSAVIS